MFLKVKATLPETCTIVEWRRLYSEKSYLSLES